MDRRFIWVVMIAWLALVATSLLWNWRQVETSVMGLARTTANSHFEKDVIYRRWGAMQGGVYVPPTEKTPPNPYLAHLPERDVTTASGKALTLVNPAYMTRQVHELAAQGSGVLGHITSLKLLRPENAPDDWERRALLAFETGAKEVYSLERMRGGQYLRFMRPLVTEPPCLKCHAFQGYKVGDVRGGISVSVPFAPFAKIAASQHRTLLWGHGLIGVLGLAGLWIGGIRLQRSKQALQQSLAVTEQKNASLQTAYEALHISTLRHQLSFESSRDALMTLVPPAWQFSSANQAALQLFGATSAAEFNPLGPLGISPPQQPDGRPSSEKAQEMIETAMREGSHFFEWELQRLDGRLFAADVLLTRMELGEEVFLQATVRDITARKKVEAELEQHRHHLEELVQQRTAELIETEAKASHILRSSADGLYGVDAQGVITFINPAACDLLGYSPEQVIGHSAHALFHHSKPDGTAYPIEACPAHNALLVGQEARNDTEVYWRADGQPIPVMYAIHPLVQDGKVTGAVTSFVDMSEQRAAAQARELALIAAENLARLRSEFLANMSHEIRTPLNGVLGFAEIGYRSYQNSEKARNAFEQILSSGKRLLGVINDILDFSKIEAGKLGIEKTEVSLVELIKQAVNLVSERVNAKHLTLLVKLAPDMPKTFVGDPLRIGQVLLNLLSNAVKFTEAGSITLSASRQGDELVFKVADSGIGMNEEQMGKLFNPFQQADGSTTRRYGGTGLGLAISKRILELMEGEIRVESQPGVGSTFEFRLPYVQAATLAAEPIPGSTSTTPEQPLAGLSILAAEDDPINQAVLENNLVEDGARVVMVANGREAVERVTQDGGEAYDIVLMDVQMPEMDGYEATRRILEVAPTLPIIGQTAYAMAEEKARCLAAGMADHIAKPIDTKALVKLVLQHVAARRGK